jgi:hypothetical protein
MGATVRITGPSTGLYLVVATASVESLVSQVGGQIALRFSSTKLLAVLSFEGFLCIKKDNRIRKIGPVSVDPQRLARFTKALGV